MSIYNLPGTDPCKRLQYRLRANQKAHKSYMKHNIQPQPNPTTSLFFEKINYLRGKGKKDISDSTLL